MSNILVAGNSGGSLVAQPDTYHISPTGNPAAIGDDIFNPTTLQSVLDRLQLGSVNPSLDSVGDTNFLLSIGNHNVTNTILVPPNCKFYFSSVSGNASDTKIIVAGSNPGVRCLGVFTMINLTLSAGSFAFICNGNGYINLGNNRLETQGIFFGSGNGSLLLDGDVILTTVQNASRGFQLTENSKVGSSSSSTPDIDCNNLAHNYTQAFIDVSQEAEFISNMRFLNFASVTGRRFQVNGGDLKLRNKEGFVLNGVIPGNQIGVISTTSQFMSHPFRNAYQLGTTNVTRNGLTTRSINQSVFMPSQSASRFQLADTNTDIILNLSGDLIFSFENNAGVGAHIIVSGVFFWKGSLSAQANDFEATWTQSIRNFGSFPLTIDYYFGFFLFNGTNTTNNAISFGARINDFQVGNRYSMPCILTIDGQVTTYDSGVYP
jgi:hypothetical protein